MVIAMAWALGACVTEQISGRAEVKENPEEAAALNVDLGISYLRQGDLQAAQAKLEKAIEKDSSNVTAYRALGLVYEQLGDAQAAEKAYRHAVSIAPRDPEALNSLGAFLCHSDANRDEALEIFDRAIAVPQSKQYANKAMLNTNAGLCIKADDLPTAEDYFRAALTVDSQFSLALEQLADVSYQRGNYLQSRAFLQRYMSEDAVSPPVLWLGVQIETAMGDMTAANEYGRQLKRDFPGSIETRKLLERERDAGT
jgi:type IV pilus assembly protein PilF